MIELKELKLPITPQQACVILQNHSNKFGIFFDLDRILEHESFYALKLAAGYPEWRRMLGDPQAVVTRKTAIIEACMKRFDIPEYKFYDDETKSLSLDKGKVAELKVDPTLSEDARRFISITGDLSKAAYMMSYLKQYKDLPLCMSESYDGNRMVVGHPVWSMLATSRISASKPSLQNISSDIGDIITAPPGYSLISSDSGQIEPRITYSYYVKDELIKRLINLYNDAYFGLLHFILMNPVEEGTARLGGDLVPMKITDEMQSARKRLKVLALAGNYGSSNLGAVDHELGPLYAEKIVKHPKRIEFQNRVTREVNNGADTFYGAFGTPITPGATGKYDIGGNGWRNHLIRCGINNPVQCTAAELMTASVYEADKILLHDEYIAAYVHDAGYFYVKEDRTEELAPKLQGCMSYQVADWIPIYSDLHIGKKESGNDTNLF